MMEENFRKFTDKLFLSNKQYKDRGETAFAKFVSSNGSITGTLMLDPRRASGDDQQELPAAIRIQYNGKKVYLRIGKKYKLDEWKMLCELERLGRNKNANERKELRARILRVELMVNKLVEDGIFTLKKLQERFSGITPEERTIYSVWDKYIEDRKIDKLGTARTNVDVKRRFVKTMGSNVEFGDIDRAFILKWSKALKKYGLSATTIGISLRTFRAIVNICIEQGLIKGDTREMFKDTGYNKSNSRKHEFLDVATMRKLYDFWERKEAKDENGKEQFYSHEKEAVFRDVGLFLFMYLGDGQNLADTLRLEYDEWYFATHGKQFRFYRQKTHDRNESASEVIFPITPELKKIIEEYGNEPKLGKRVFLILPTLIMPDKELWVIQRYNKYIGKHMGKVADILGLEQKPTSTWARHSFATNLNNSGKVPYKYISDSMGHSSSGDITSNYIGAYPLEKMVEYNWYLLNEREKSSQQATSKQELLTLLKSMTEAEREELLASI
jgi:hypothetical protein